MELNTHWDRVYRSKGAKQVSWYRPHLDTSLLLVHETHLRRDRPILDVGAGASTLVDDLLRQGYSNLTALDVSFEGLSLLRSRLGTQAKRVNFIVGNIVNVELHSAQFALWHDRAVFHFLTDPALRQRYVEQLHHALRPDGFVIIGTFGPRGPERCSGLPTARYSARDVTDFLGGEFQLIAEREERHVTPASIKQQFMYGLWKRHRREPL